MDPEVPSWLNDSLLSTAIEDEEGVINKIKVRSFSVSPAVSEGNNFAGSLLRVKVEYTVEHHLKTTSLIVKAPIAEGAIGKILVDNDLLDKEWTIYNLFLPLVNKKINSRIAPKSFKCSVENVLVLEDLKGSGYIMCDKLKKLDFQHCKQVFMNIAKYHAASVSCHHDDPNFIETLGKERYFSGKTFVEGYKKWLENSVKISGEMLSETDDCSQAGKYFLSRCDHIAQSVLRICTPKEKGLNVLNHGDLWINNLLYQHTDSGDVNDVKIVDFQYPRYGSPAIDLLFLIWSSADEEVLVNRQKELYSAYLEVLNSTLSDLKCQERMTMEELQKDLKWASDWAVYIICGELPLMVCEPESANDFSQVELIEMGNYEALKREHYNKNYKTIFPIVAKQLMTWLRDVS